MLESDFGLSFALRVFVWSFDSFLLRILKSSRAKALYWRPYSNKATSCVFCWKYQNGIAFMYVIEVNGWMLTIWKLLTKFVAVCMGRVGSVLDWTRTQTENSVFETREPIRFGFFRIRFFSDSVWCFFSVRWTFKSMPKTIWACSDFWPYNIEQILYYTII